MMVQFEIQCNCDSAKILEVTTFKEKLPRCPQCLYPYRINLDSLVEKKEGIIGDYRAICSLETGPFANSYLVVDGTKQLFTMKLFSQGIYDFADGLKNWQKLKHPNIIKLLKTDTYQKRIYIITDYIPGIGLSEILKKTHLRIDHVIIVVVKILEGLCYMHSLGIVHKNLKPSNIIVNPLQTVFLTDVMEPELKERVSFNYVLNTSYYIPPETLKHQKNINFYSNIYCIGAILYHALCGEPPFYVDKKMNKIIWCILNGDYVPIKEKRPSVPQALIKIVEKSLCCKPEDRYSSAQEMKDALVQFYSNIKK